ncbi:MAG: rRNA maturation RNase YbeY [Dehalococcoidia bacterium]|nr:rRNA maturation RNase YbeY [Dehalococcoidia bacterium]
MPQPLVGVDIDQEFREHVDEVWVRALAQSVLEQEGPEKPVELEIRVTGDETVQELNHLYRGLDCTTDVLSFALTEGEDFVAPPDGILHLGEVIVSYPQAERQAREMGKGAAQEVALLLVHGILHLLGYDHAEEEDEKTMRAREAVLLQTVFGGAPT